MRLVDEFRDPALARALAHEIRALAPSDRSVRIMEVCGGHTHAICKHGLEDLLPPQVELLHGPGCPVCVIPAGRVDDAIALALRPEVTLASFGDMLRVPGARRSLLDARAQGADVRMVYSPLDALELARRLPAREVVFLAVGFETTAPATAVTLRCAQAEGVANFSAFCNHVTIAPPLRAILEAPGARVDAFVAPGHVSTVVGTRPYDFIVRDHARPVVVAGFEPLDLLQAIAMILRQVRERRCEVENQYLRAVRVEGNPRALAAIEETMEPRDAEWRGLGTLPGSGLAIRPHLAAHDAERRFELPRRRVEDPKACQCAAVLTGKLKPWECRVFGTACTPERPLGTCMVSAEGTCAAYYAYGRLRRREAPRPETRGRL